MKKIEPLLVPRRLTPSRWLRPTLRSVLTIVALVAADAIVSAQAADKKPNILVIFGDDIGQTNVSAYSMGVMG